MFFRPRRQPRQDRRQPPRHRKRRRGRTVKDGSNPPHFQGVAAESRRWLVSIDPCDDVWRRCGSRRPPIPVWPRPASFPPGCTVRICEVWDHTGQVVRRGAPPCPRQSIRTGLAALQAARRRDARLGGQVGQAVKVIPLRLVGGFWIHELIIPSVCAPVDAYERTFLHN